MIDSKAIRIKKKILPSVPKVLAYEKQILQTQIRREINPNQDPLIY